MKLGWVTFHACEAVSPRCAIFGLRTAVLFFFLMTGMIAINEHFYALISLLTIL